MPDTKLLAAEHVQEACVNQLLRYVRVLLLFQDWYEGITRKLKWNQSIRGISGTTSGGLETAILQKAAAAASGTHAAELQPQLSLGGLVSDLTAAAHNEAKVRTVQFLSPVMTWLISQRPLSLCMRMTDTVAGYLCKQS